MRAPQLVEVASLHPGFCFTCGTVDGPFVDSMVDVPGDGRLYVCVRNCLGVWARLAGFEEAALSEGYIAERDATIERLTEELKQARPMAELMQDALRNVVENEPQPVSPIVEGPTPVDADGDPIPTPEPSDEPEQTPEPLPDANPTCTATKKNGQPCTAQALPGRDVCLAHAKKAA